MSDPTELPYMKLKKWLVAAGAPKAKLDKCFDKDSLLIILPEYREAGLAAEAAGGAPKPAAAAAATKPAVVCSSCFVTFGTVAKCIALEK